MTKKTKNFKLTVHTEDDEELRNWAKAQVAGQITSVVREQIAEVVKANVLPDRVTKLVEQKISSQSSYIIKEAIESWNRSISTTAPVSVAVQKMVRQYIAEEVRRTLLEMVTVAEIKEIIQTTVQNEIKKYFAKLTE